MLAAFILLVGPPVTFVPLGPGDHARSIRVDGRKRTYLVHVPRKLNREHRAPLVLALHGAAMTGRMMVGFSGLSKKADEAGFLVAYPDGTAMTWNSGGLRGELGRGKPDDVRFLSRMIDDICTVLRVDESRVYATGMSNGGMMCYRLANELSGRIAAVAPVAGTMSIARARPARAVPLLHIHCRGDRIVPYERPASSLTARFMRFASAPGSTRAWAKATHCAEKPVTSTIKPANGEKTRIIKEVWKGKKGGEVVLISIEGGGHVWPGRPFPFGLIPMVKSLDANDVIWEFFQKHRLPKR